MKSPFPGMDPYLERHWLDVHHRLVTHAAESLNERLPSDLVATTDERVAVESDEEIERLIGPDVKVFSPSSADPEEGADGSIAVDAPFKIVVDIEPIKEYFVRIIDQSGTLITVIEFLSPTNKRGEGLDEYRRKRHELLKGSVNLVEIDLVRAGNWRTLLRPAICPKQAVSTYRAIVRTARGALAGYVYPIRLNAPAPDISVPLRRGDPVPKLPLQLLIDQVYERGRYHLRINYSEPLDPPLEGDERALAEQILSNRSVG